MEILCACLLRSQFTRNRFRPIALVRKLHLCKIKCSSVSSLDIYTDYLVLKEEMKYTNLVRPKPRSCNLFLRSGRPPTKNMKDCGKECIGQINSEKSLNDCITQALDNNNFTELEYYVELYKYRNVCPPKELICDILAAFAQVGNLDGIRVVQSLIYEFFPTDYASHSGFIHYTANALWVQRKVTESIGLFGIAHGNKLIRNNVNIMLKDLFPLVISHHGEAVLDMIVIFIKDLAISTDDFILLGFLWKEMFKSEWFCDHEIANTLLKDSGITIQLLNVIQWMIPSMGKHFLEEHKIDLFHRLLELTLKNDLKNLAAILIRELFDYYYVLGDVKRCTAVLKSSSYLDFPLTVEQQKRYINLLLNYKTSPTSQGLVKKPAEFQLDF